MQDETKTCDGRVKDRAFFEDTMGAAFAEGRRVLRADGVGSVVFAHKTTEGWEALLAGMIRSGWTITGSWPIATEMGTRLRARDSAALATSIHLVCRPRPADAPVGDWMERLQNERVRGADLVFACIGPALEIFSRYPRVETADGREVGLAEYLEKVWEVVGRTALRTVLGEGEAKARNGLAGALEEDARLTALFLWTLQSTSADDGAAADESAEADEMDGADDAPRGKAAGYTLIFDVVRRFAQPLGIRLPDWEGRIVETAKGVVACCRSQPARRSFSAEAASARRRRRLNATQPATRNHCSFPTTPPPRPVRPRGPAPCGAGRRPSGKASSGRRWRTGRPTPPRRHHARPRARRDAAPGVGPEPGAPRPAEGGAGPRSRLPPAGERAVRPLSAGRRGEALAGRNAAGGAAMTPCIEPVQVRT